MALRSVLLLSLGLALTPAPANATTLAGHEAAEGTCRRYPGLNRVFRFGTGFRPSAPPVVSAEGAIYVGTGDGYVHALHPDGSFYWSYTVKGPVTGRIAMTSSGRTLLVPAPYDIYALRADGSLSWSAKTLEGVQSGLTRDNSGRFRFVSKDGRVFTVTDRGKRGTPVLGKVRVTAGPLVLPDGLAIGRVDGTIQVVRRGKTRIFRRKRAIQVLLTCPGPGLCAIAGNMLTAVEPRSRSKAFQLPALYAASARGSAKDESWLAVLTAQSELALFTRLPGEPRYRVELPAAVSAEPAVDTRGTVYVPLQSGALVMVTPDGVIAGCAPIANTPLGTPVVDEAHRRVLVTASEGVLTALELP